MITTTQRYRIFAATVVLAALTACVSPLNETRMSVEPSKTSMSIEKAASTLTVVHSFDQAPGNPAIGIDGRIFLSMHQMYEPTYRVMELTNGSLRPYPTLEWASNRDAQGIGLTAVLGIQTDQVGRLWMLDNGGPGKTQPRFVVWNTTTEALDRIVEIEASGYTEDSFLQDFAVDNQRGKAYIADMAGALVVVDTTTGAARRTLDAHSSTMAEDVDFVVREKVLTDPSGKPIRNGLNPIVISPDGRWVYYGAMNGKTIYRVPAASLADDNMSATKLKEKVERVGNKNPSDGISIDGAGNIYVADGTQNGIGVLRNNQSYEMLLTDARIEWPDGLSAGPDGRMYFTVNRLNTRSPLNGGEIDEVEGGLYLMSFEALSETVVGR